LARVRVDVLLETFGVDWRELRQGAILVERAGFDGVWVNDHLAGSVQGARHVLECWTALSALASEVPRIDIGPLVLNVANRDPGTLAVMAATLQQVSGGRLLLGLGAGAAPGSSYAIEQVALGRRVPADPDRREAVERTVATLRRVWSGAVAEAAGFLRPDPVPPVVIAASGPKMAELAGRVGDGLCVRGETGMAELVGVARRAYADTGRSRERLIVMASLTTLPQPMAPWAGLDLDRLIVYLAPPFAEGVGRLATVVTGWRREVERPSNR
jgi:alkanesulfonate monooxygenase SsuD/methylene tetrahydromethanopterin reductase-like flavin-dependent oxidoreductase (luciferase family)